MTSAAITVSEPEATDQADYVKAILNILEDFSTEKVRLADTQKAVLNILEDFSSEKSRLEATQKAILNILEDFDAEKNKVERANVELRREVAERRQAELALVQRTKELARSNAELEQFAYVASHDLQEPLRMVSSYVQLFEKRYRGQVDEQADKYIYYAVEGARRMQALIGGLLEYSRMGRQDAELTQVSSQIALDQALANLRAALEEADVTVSHDPMPDVIVDSAQLYQVFQNLIGNAIKFRRPGVPSRIHVAVDVEASPYVFSVEDNGIGIAPQYADRVFVIFQRLHTRAEYPGTGIGLSICKKVIERHGGRIWVESRLGEGAAFRFTLPVPSRTP
jgi:light-regulated signal transduction histidine kinase (bacteriophytochrome)